MKKEIISFCLVFVLMLSTFISAFATEIDTVPAERAATEDVEAANADEPEPEIESPAAAAAETETSDAGAESELMTVGAAETDDEVETEIESVENSSESVISSISEEDPQETQPPDLDGENIAPIEGGATTDGQAEIASGTCGENLTWTLTEDGTLTISGSGEMENYNPYVDSYPEWHDFNVRSVIISDGVSSIGDAAFAYCINLVSVEIPKSVSSIGVEAFFACHSLSALEIPEGVSSIGNTAFRMCSSLREVKIPEGVSNIDVYTFDGCSSLSSVEIPESVSSIGEGAFRGCTSMSNVVISEGVSSIGWQAFHDCTSLTNITIPKSVESIDSYALGYKEGSTRVDGFTISGYAGSEAQIYAEGNNIPFIELSEEVPDDTTPNTYVVKPEASSLSYLLTSGSDVTIYSTGELKDFIQLLVDGQVVDPQYYDLAEGSTVLTLHSEFLETLAPGDHPATLEYTDGTAECTIKIIEKESESETKAPETPQTETQASGTNGQNNGTSGGSGNAGAGSSTATTGTPRTGDDTNLPLWFAVLFLSMTGGSFALGVKRKYQI